MKNKHIFLGDGRPRSREIGRSKVEELGKDEAFTGEIVITHYTVGSH